MPSDPSEPNPAAALFDAIAPTYDSTGVDFFQPIADGLVAAIGPRAGESLLDVGCGRGAVLLRAAPMVSPAIAAGVDISPAMIALAQAAARESGLDNVVLRVDDASAPDATAGAYDIITASLVLFFLPDPVRALAAWLDLLRPGGRLGVATFGPVDERWMHVDATLLPYLPPNDARTSGAKGPFSDDAGVAGLLESAGFVDVRTVSDTLAVRFDSREQWLAFSMSTGQRAAWARVPDDLRASVREEAMSRLVAFAEPDGSVTFTQGVRYSLGRRPAG